MLTPGSTPPDASVTSPVMAPVACAAMRPGSSKRETPRQATARRVKQMSNIESLTQKSQRLQKSRRPQKPRKPPAAERAASHRACFRGFSGLSGFCVLRVRRGLQVLAQQVAAEVAVEVAPDRVNVV